MSTQVTHTEIREVLARSGVVPERITLLDQDYCLPTPEWITGPLRKSLGDFLFYSGIQYVDQRFDCDDFAATAANLAGLCWAKTPGAPMAGLAIGMFGFIDRYDTSHCIICAIHKREQGLYPAWYEPQPSVEDGQAAFQNICLTPVKLTSEEAQSCLCCLFL